MLNVPALALAGRKGKGGGEAYALVTRGRGEVALHLTRWLNSVEAW